MEEPEEEKTICADTSSEEPQLSNRPLGTKGSSFKSYPEISEKTAAVLTSKGYLDLFPIQAETFRFIFNGDDMIARDLTGSGKTLAFCLPLVEKFRSKGCFNYATNGKQRVLRAIILAPTRELALQTARVLETIKHTHDEYKVITVYGGVPIENQARDLKNGVEFFVGTTGRVLDHINRQNITFNNIKCVCLDEAD
jgi:ATP-dependent RNA helicase DDX21